MTVLSQGTPTREGENVTFNNLQNLTGLSLCMGMYEKRAVTVDSVTIEFYTYPGGTGSRISFLRYGSVVELQGFVNGRDRCFFGDGERYTGARDGICHGDYRADCIFSRTDSRREVV